MNTLIRKKEQEFNGKKHYIFIKNDLFKIVNRLREIDDGYFIVFNTMKKKYEVHNVNNILGTYCFTVPYKTLDARTYFYALKTRIEKSDELLKEIERENERIKKERHRQTRNEIKARAFDTRSLFMKED